MIDSALFDAYDRCPRRVAYERTHDPLTISTMGLLYVAVEASMTADNPCQAVKDAIAERMSWMDLNAGDLSPMSAVRHVEALAEVIALALRERLGRGKRPDQIPIGDGIWNSNLFECRGVLHRIILAEYLGDDSLRSYAHSWRTIGELAALERSLTLTAVIVGAQRGGRRHSQWSKGFLHPVQKTLRIGRRKEKKADGFTTGWKEVWREQTEIKAETWLERMKADEVLDELITSRRITYRGDDLRMKTARREMMELIPLIEAASVEAPMRRSSCDEIGRGPCPWQPMCYSSHPVTVDQMPHLYRRRETPLVTLTAETSGDRTCAHKP